MWKLWLPSATGFLNLLMTSSQHRKNKNVAKPICVIYFPERFEGVSVDRNWIYEYMQYLNGEKVASKNYWQHTDYWKDYYWFCFYKEDINEPQFDVFYEKDFGEIKFEELKKIVLESIEQTKSGEDYRTS